jgi:hypothetical protein
VLPTCLRWPHLQYSIWSFLATSKTLVTKLKEGKRDRRWQYTPIVLQRCMDLRSFTFALVMGTVPHLATIFPVVGSTLFSVWCAEKIWLPDISF